MIANENDGGKRKRKEKKKPHIIVIFEQNSTLWLMHEMKAPRFATSFQSDNKPGHTI